MKVLGSVDMTDHSAVDEVLAVALGLRAVAGQAHQQQPIDQFVAAEDFLVVLEVPLAIADQIARALVSIEGEELVAQMARLAGRRLGRRFDLLAQAGQ